MNFLNIPSLHFVVRFPQLILQRKTLAPRTSVEHVITGTNLNAKLQATYFYTKTVTILPVDTAAILNSHFGRPAKNILNRASENIHPAR